MTQEMWFYLLTGTHVLVAALSMLSVHHYHTTKGENQ